MSGVTRSRYQVPHPGTRRKPAQGRGGWLRGEFWKVALCAAFLLALTLGGCSNGSESTTSSGETGHSKSGAVASSAGKSQSQALELTPAQMRGLQALINQPGASPESALRAQIILAVAAGMDNDEISRKFGVDADQVDLGELLNQL